jgi:hypothetical protein
VTLLSPPSFVSEAGVWASQAAFPSIHWNTPRIDRVADVVRLGIVGKRTLVDASRGILVVDAGHDAAGAGPVPEGVNVLLSEKVAAQDHVRAPAQLDPVGAGIGPDLDVHVEILARHIVEQADPGLLPALHEHGSHDEDREEGLEQLEHGEHHPVKGRKVSAGW